MKAVWKNAVLAESSETIVVEGDCYFPSESLNRRYFEDSATRTDCPKIGEARYYTVTVGSSRNADAAWYYPDPKEEFSHIKNYVAFWKGITICD